MDKPIVSILIPAYNVAAYLPQCLDSVLNQTYRDLLVVIVDDGSKDDTLAVAQGYADKDGRVEIYHQDNQGVAATRNHLLDKVKGDYVLFVDADDWIEPDMVEYLVNIAQDHGTDFAMCDRLINDAGPSRKEPKVFELDQEHAIVDFLYHDYFVGALWNKLFKKNVIEGVRFNKEIWYGEDALFTWGVLQKTEKVVVSDKQLYHQYMNEKSISHQSFGEKKLTGHQTWTIISEDVKTRWPQYTDLVLGTFARSDMYLLQQASMSGYPKDDNIKELQSNVRKNFKYLVPRLKTTKRILLMGTIIMFWYGFGKVYQQLHQIKSKI